ncbi:hypothetical protein Q5692_35530 [Microcoleus sp. C2C3]|uniref:hypothetical protein n=1 Tax=unclassified Microcoleus TaxID=2642155 RepID=UPI002FD27377
MGATHYPPRRDRIDLIRHLRHHLQQQLEGETFKLEYKQQIDCSIAYPSKTTSKLN